MSNTLPPDPYKVLGVSRGARLPEIRSAHRKLVHNCHPEKVQDAALKAIKQDEFQKAQQAHELLSDDTRRRQYDEQVKLFELKEDMGRGNPTSRSNPSEYEILMAEPRAPPYSSRAYTANHPARPLFQDDGEELPRRSSVRKSMIDNEPGSHDSSSRIEEEIKARNAKVYENLKHAASGGKASTNSDAKSKADEGTDTTKAAAKVMLTTVPPEQLGMKVMNPGTTKTSVDIIAVHGLGAIPEITWQEKHSGKNWLADTEMLPKAVPEARIMRFGYDSLWLGKEAIKTRLSTIANKLLLVLKREREDAQERPLIFIGHCFGGLVIQRALIIAKLLEVTFPGILTSSVGVIFLGTPHRGSKSFLPQSALLASIAAQSDLHGRIEPGVLSAMRSDSGASLDVAEDFADLCRDLKLQITCFFEERKSNLGKVIGRTDIQEFMVPEESATFDGHPRYGLPLDHFSLNKFPGPDNGNFKDVCGEITRLYGVAMQNLLAGKPNPYQPAKISPKFLHRTQTSLSLNKSFMEQEGEEDLIKKAAKELKEEDFEKKYQERVAADAKEKEEENKESQQRYKERLVANMKKYDVPDPEEIVNIDPLPNDTDLKPQEIKDKMRWYKNRVKVALLQRRVPDGIIDEILNDTSDTMVIDGIQMTYTKMALKWISLRTLKRYGVPHIVDQEDPSTVIIKRWVPEYEQEFLWDHTYKLRSGDKGRRTTTERKSTPKSSTPPPLYTSNSYTRYGAQSPAKYYRTNTTPNLGSRSHSYESVRRGYEPESSNRGRNHSGSFNEKNPQASHESVTSAPNSEDIAMRRKHSRTLSNECLANRPHKQSSYESVRSLRETRKEHSWASDEESAARKSSGILSGIKKSFERSTVNGNPTPREYEKQRRTSGDERRQGRPTSSRLKKAVEYDSDD